MREGLNEGMKEGLNEGMKLALTFDHSKFLH